MPWFRGREALEAIAEVIVLGVGQQQGQTQTQEEDSASVDT